MTTAFSKHKKKKYIRGKNRMARVAQSIERQTFSLNVKGSSPLPGFNIIFFRKGLFRCKVFLYRAYIFEQSSLDEMKGI